MSRSIPAWAGEPPSRFPLRFPLRVYPRVGGGTLLYLSRWDDQAGLSPRGRGNPRQIRAGLVFSGSIPAWAGEPLFALTTSSTTKVYPRVGGGTNFEPPTYERKERSIPAWAGEPRSYLFFCHSRWVYPRVGGGTGLLPTRRLAVRGLSPRGRGNPLLRKPSPDLKRSIPAWAGEPRALPRMNSRAPVYPRVGGGTASLPVLHSIAWGLSPRGRGNQFHFWARLGKIRSIPAWAGEPGTLTKSTGYGKVYPRVGGGTRKRSRLSLIAMGLSPRGRGNHRRAPWRKTKTGSIPAWAGEPRLILSLSFPCWVYPRVGGGTMAWSASFPVEEGLSPRGRGNLLMLPVRFAWRRSIPAWAGEPPTRPRASFPYRVYPRVGGGTPPALVRATSDIAR